VCLLGAARGIVRGYRQRGPPIRRSKNNLFRDDLIDGGCGHVSNRSGFLQSHDPDLLRVNLLPSGSATVQRKGILFESLYYEAQTPDFERWKVKAHESSVYSLPISHDPRFVDVIYIRPLYGASTLMPCTLSPLSQQFAGWSFAEVQDHQKKQKAEEEHHASDTLENKVNIHTYAESVIDGARAKNKLARGSSKAARKASGGNITCHCGRRKYHVFHYRKMYW